MCIRVGLCVELAVPTQSEVYPAAAAIYMCGEHGRGEAWLGCFAVGPDRLPRGSLPTLC